MVFACMLLLGIGFPLHLVDSNIYLLCCLLLAIVGVVTYVRSVKGEGRY